MLVVIVVYVEEREREIVDPLGVPESLVDDGEGIENLHNGFSVVGEPRVLRGACNVEADLFVVRSVLELDGGVG